MINGTTYDGLVTEHVTFTHCLSLVTLKGRLDDNSSRLFELGLYTAHM